VLDLSPTRRCASPAEDALQTRAARGALTSVVGGTVAWTAADSERRHALDDLHTLPTVVRDWALTPAGRGASRYVVVLQATRDGGEQWPVEAALVDRAAPALLGYTRFSVPADRCDDELATSLATFVAQSLPPELTRESLTASAGKISASAGHVPADAGRVAPAIDAEPHSLAVPTNAAGAAASSFSASDATRDAPRLAPAAPRKQPLGASSMAPALLAPHALDAAHHKRLPTTAASPAEDLLRAFAGGGVALGTLGTAAARPRVFEAAWQTLLLPAAGTDGRTDPQSHPVKVVCSVYSTASDYQVEVRFSRPVKLTSRTIDGGWTTFDVAGYQIEQEQSTELGDTGFTVLHARPGDSAGTTRFGLNVRGGGAAKTELGDAGRLLVLAMPKVSSPVAPDGRMPAAGPDPTRAAPAPLAPGGCVLSTFTGRASWYGSDWQGRLTANGERFNMYALTAAHKTLPLGSIVRVTNLNNGRSVVVRINDRGPYAGGRVLDLSEAAAQALDFIHAGVCTVRCEVLDRGH
jgi:hypothetical protein